MSIITVRTDPEVDSALEALMADAIDRSDAVRRAILLAHDVQKREALRAEAARLAADPADREEARRVLEEMESLRAR